MQNFSNLFWNETLHVSVSSSVHHQEIFTVYTTMVYVVQVCWQLASRSICSCSQAVNKPVRHIPLLCIQWKTPDDGQRNCPKHVEFHSKNKLEKSVHLVGFIIRNLSRCTVTRTSNGVWCALKATRIIQSTLFSDTENSEDWSRQTLAQFF